MKSKWMGILFVCACVTVVGVLFLRFLEPETPRLPMDRGVEQHRESRPRAPVSEHPVTPPGNAGKKTEQGSTPPAPKRPAASADPVLEDGLAFTNSIGMRFVYIPAGTFMMGSPLEEPGRYDRETRHQVALTRGFFLQTTEVTQAQWTAVMKDNPSRFAGCGPDCPVEQVSWDDVYMFIRKLNQQERTRKYGLPTEAQWEYACRAGTHSRFHWGDAPDCSKANFGVGFLKKECKDKNPGRTNAVKSHEPNPWGLFDMHGNVAEWCVDRFGPYPHGEITDPDGAYSAVNRVYRGGSWADASRYCRAANRDEAMPTDRHPYLGFRVAADAIK